MLSKIPFVKKMKNTLTDSIQFLFSSLSPSTIKGADRTIQSYSQISPGRKQCWPSYHQHWISWKRKSVSKTSQRARWDRMDLCRSWELDVWCTTIEFRCCIHFWIYWYSICISWSDFWIEWKERWVLISLGFDIDRQPKVFHQRHYSVRQYIRIYSHGLLAQHVLGLNIE